MFRRLLSVGGFTLVSRITGFTRDILMAAILGKSALSDAFIVAFLFPGYFRAVFGEGTINPAFLPRYAALRARGDESAAVRFGNQIFSWQMATQLVILVLALGGMPWIIRVVAPGFSDNPQQFALTVHLSRITFPYLILTVVAVQLSAMLNAREKFAAAAAWPIFLNLAMISTLIGEHWFPNAAYAAAWGVLFGGVAQLFFILFASRHDGLSLRLVRPRWTPRVKEFFTAFGAVTVGAASTVAAPFIDTIIASLLPTGSRTALYYADRIDQLPLGVLGIALGTVLLPEMSSRLAVGDRAGSDAAQNRAAVLSLFLMLPFAVVFVLIPDTIMRAVFAHGAFDRHAAALAAVALTAYGVGLPAFAMSRIIQSAFYARHDTMTPARVTMAAIAINIALKVVFVWGFHFGIGGIALGTSLGAWSNVAILSMLAYSRDFLRVDSTFWRALPATLLAAALAGAGAFAGRHVGLMLATRPGTLQNMTEFGVAAAFGIAAYLAVTYLFRDALPLGRLSRNRPPAGT
jgi:putative peptidoglycan lipid II flippase